MFKASIKTKDIVKVEVEKTIKNFVIINGKSKLAHTGTRGYFGKFEEAKTWLSRCLDNQWEIRKTKMQEMGDHCFRIGDLEEEHLTEISNDS